MAYHLSSAVNLGWIDMKPGGSVCYDEYFKLYHSHVDPLTLWQLC